jgi:hypothetical protein
VILTASKLLAGLSFGSVKPKSPVRVNVYDISSGVLTVVTGSGRSVVHRIDREIERVGRSKRAIGNRDGDNGDAILVTLLA